jgi:hypothetical protein
MCFSPPIYGAFGRIFHFPGFLLAFPHTFFHCSKVFLLISNCFSSLFVLSYFHTHVFQKFHTLTRICTIIYARVLPHIFRAFWTIIYHFQGFFPYFILINTFFDDFARLHAFTALFYVREFYSSFCQGFCTFLHFSRFLQCFPHIFYALIFHFSTFLLALAHIFSLFYVYPTHFLWFSPSLRPNFIYYIRTYFLISHSHFQATCSIEAKTRTYGKHAAATPPTSAWQSRNGSRQRVSLSLLAFLQSGVLGLELQSWLASLRVVATFLQTSAVTLRYLQTSSTIDTVIYIRGGCWKSQQEAAQSTPLSALSSTAHLSRLPMQNRRRCGGLYFAPRMTLRMLSKRRITSIGRTSSAMNIQNGRVARDSSFLWMT